MRNIYDIFEERKFDVFYQENFSFDNLNEIYLVCENMERIFINEEFIVMEGFKEKVGKFMIDTKSKLEKFIEVLIRFIKDLIKKFKEKYFPVSNKIKKIGVDNIVKELEGKKVKRFHKYRADALARLNKVTSEVINELNDPESNKAKLSFKLTNIEDIFYDVDNEIVGEPLKREDIVNCLGIVLNQNKFYDTIDKFGVICNKRSNELLKGANQLESAFISTFISTSERFVKRTTELLNSAMTHAMQLVNQYKGKNDDENENDDE